jgi:hypothetical protein
LTSWLLGLLLSLLLGLLELRFLVLPLLFWPLHRTNVTPNPSLIQQPLNIRSNSWQPARFLSTFSFFYPSPPPFGRRHGDWQWHWEDHRRDMAQGR